MMSTPSARLRRDRTTDTVTGRRIRAVVIAQAASAIFASPTMFAINPREIPPVASSSVTRFIFAAFIVYPFDNLLKSAFGDQLASTRILVVASSTINLDQHVARLYSPTGF